MFVCTTCLYAQNVSTNIVNICMDITYAYHVQFCFPNHNSPFCLSHYNIDFLTKPVRRPRR